MLMFCLQATEQIKVVKEVVNTFRSPVKEDGEEWQLVSCPTMFSSPLIPLHLIQFVLVLQ